MARPQLLICSTREYPNANIRAPNCCKMNALCQRTADIAREYPPLDSCTRLVASVVSHASAACEAEPVGEEADGIPALDPGHRNGFLLSRRGKAYAQRHGQQRHGFVDRDGEGSAVSTSKMPKNFISACQAYGGQQLLPNGSNGCVGRHFGALDVDLLSPNNSNSAVQLHLATASVADRATA